VRGALLRRPGGREETPPLFRAAHGGARVDRLCPPAGRPLWRQRPIDAPPRGRRSRGEAAEQGRIFSAKHSCRARETASPLPRGRTPKLPQTAGPTCAQVKPPTDASARPLAARAGAGKACCLQTARPDNGVGRPPPAAAPLARPPHTNAHPLAKKGPRSPPASSVPQPPGRARLPKDPRKERLARARAANGATLASSAGNRTRHGLHSDERCGRRVLIGLGARTAEENRFVVVCAARVCARAAMPMPPVDAPMWEIVDTSSASKRWYRPRAPFRWAPTGRTEGPRFVLPTPEHRRRRRPIDRAPRDASPAPAASAPL